MEKKERKPRESMRAWSKPCRNADMENTHGGFRTHCQLPRVHKSTFSSQLKSSFPPPKLTNQTVGEFKTS